MNIGGGLAIAALARVAGHLVIVRYAFRTRLIESPRANILFLAPVIEATAAAIGVAIPLVVPEALPARDYGLVIAAPPLLTGAIALVQLSADKAGSRSADQRP